MHMKDLDFAVLPWIGLLLALASLTGVQLLMKTGGFIRLLPKWMRFATVFLRWLLVVVVLSILLIAIGPLRHLESIPFQNRTAAQSAAGAADPGKLTDEAIKSNIDELKWMLTILAGFAVITALAQAAAAWMSALTYDKQASAKLQEIEKTLDNFNARYPVFAMVEEKRNQAHDAVIVSLRKVFGTADEQGDPTEAISWMKDFYHELSVEKRQLLLSVESFASIDVHPPHRGSRVQNLKLFAVVYHAKYRYERGMGAFALFNDLERAESYLLLALRESPADFTLYNELGNIYLTMWETAGKLSSDYPDYLQKAQKAFEDSMDFEGNQQRAPYNLAFIEYQCGKTTLPPASCWMRRCVIPNSGKNCRPLVSLGHMFTTISPATGHVCWCLRIRV